MNQKGFASRALLLFVIGALVFGACLWYIVNAYTGLQNNRLLNSPISAPRTANCNKELKQCSDGSVVGRQGPNCEFAACPPTTTSTTPSVTCAIDFSDFAVPPLPPVGSDWIQSTSSAGKFVNSDAFSIWPRPSSTGGSLSGERWFANGNGLGGWDRNYYYPILTRQGWSRETVVDGYEIYGMMADGYHGSIDGYVKIAGGYLRSITINDYTSNSTEPNKLIVFASDIVPLSKIIPDYQPNCPVVSPSAQFQNYPYIQLQMNVPDGVVVADPSGKRVGKDVIAGATYNEIPDASYSAFGVSQNIFIPNPIFGQYSVTISGSLSGYNGYTGYGLSVWIGGNKNPVPLVQDIVNSVTSGQAVVYAFNYDSSGVTSSTLFVQTTSIPVN
ncbi:MAG TPA: hypothetical protein VMC43_01515 [Candidatus Paceibacterota bacterium]|nr:hypothetical protein [Candidatus Paceibacterota bacterium]